jgi:hypothetical protein
MSDAKLVVRCHCCRVVIEVTPPPNFPDTEPYETVIKRGNVVCESCFRRLSYRR